MDKKNSKKIGVVLSGGTLRGAAHIGVLRELHRMGIEPAMIAGTSVGGLVATMYGRGLSLNLLEEIVREFDGRKLLDISLPTFELMWAVLLFPLYYFRVLKHISQRVPPGFIVGAKFEAWLRKLIKITPTRLPIPHLITSTDLLSGDAIVFYGATEQPHPLPRVQFVPMADPALAIRASCSLPGVFLPRENAPHLLVDGALRNNLPIDLLHHLGCEKVIAVDLHKSQMDDHFKVSYLSVMDRMMDIMLDELMEIRIGKYRPFVIRPNLDGVGWTTWDALTDAVEIGADATKAVRAQLFSYLLHSPGQE
ncbi:patatin-like phospholipase family protein [Sulfoacidibacillus thermotolerans]|uniref:PNPLA domain-containing protein n=1 Tax=Sulfoacidibacillus thermotolerans TaxID=1765684 RepID=A0A2U3DBA0_SULT2|nr:patatin-like phospholipase family protein [Sulfoacidibacillus thermotolerans]PWI58553.1 hypothetical protein BM613_03295 [Sulfoacidibacillus thermotolerans]